jgi:hypothetical protein
MNTNKNETNLDLKRTQSPYIMIRENIYDALDLYSLSLYMAFRYESDFSKEDATIRRSAKYLSAKAKISIRQFFLSLNILEDLGLVMRDPSSPLNSISIYHVAQDLNYFNTDCRGVHGVHTGVHGMHTDHYSFPLNNNTNGEFANSRNSSNGMLLEDESIDSAVAEPKKKSKPKIDLRQLIDIYGKWFPDNPQPHEKTITNELEKVLRTLIRRWPEAHTHGLQFTPEQFEKYMECLSQDAPKFSKGEYTTEKGNKRKNTMVTFCRWDNFIKFLQGEYS